VRPPGFEPGLQAREASQVLPSTRELHSARSPKTRIAVCLYPLYVAYEPTSLVKVMAEQLVKEFHKGLAKTVEILARRYGYQKGQIKDELQIQVPPLAIEESALDPKELLNRLEEFREYLAGELELEDLTIKGYMGIIRRFLRWAGDRWITRELIREYKLTLRNASKATRANFVKAARRFFRDFLGRPDLIEGMKMPRETALERAKRNILIGASRGELKRFYEALQTDEVKAIFMLLLKSGLRVHEVLGLRFCDMDFQRRMINPAEGSATKRTWVTFYDEEAAEALRKWMEIRGAPKSLDERIFKMQTRVGIEKQFRKASQETGVKLRPKDLRVIFAKMLRRAGVDSIYIDAFCGRVPASIQAIHYMGDEYSPENLECVYKQVEKSLKILF